MGFPYKDSQSRHNRDMRRKEKRQRKSERERQRRDKKVSDKYGKVAHGSCGRKTRFKSESSANRYIERHPTLELACYKCDFCGGWHLTSHPLHVANGQDERRGSGLTVREVFQAAREAAIEIRKIEEEMQTKRDAIGVQGHGYETHSKSGILDPSRKILELIEWEESQVNSESLQQPIDEAYELLAGIQTIADDLSVEITSRYYLQAESWHEIAKSLEPRVESLAGLSRNRQVSLLSRTMDAAMSQWERVGIAHLRDMGRNEQA